MRLLHLRWPDLCLRLEDARQPLPLGPLVLGGHPWEPGSVIEADRVATRLGVRRGQSLAVAHRLAPEATFLPADPPAYRAAMEQALDALAAFTPSLEGEADPSAPAFGRVLLGIEGLERLWGDEPTLVRRIATAIAPLLPGPPRAGIAGTRFGAGVAAAVAGPPVGERLAPADRPSLVVVPDGGPTAEAAFLAPLPIRLLPADEAARERFRTLGLIRIGDLARLPRSAVVARFGPTGGDLHDLASGRDGRLLVPRRPTDRLRAEAELEPPVAMLEPLRFVLHDLCAVLCAQLAARGAGATGAVLELTPERGPLIRLVQPLPEPVAHGPLVERVLVDRLQAAQLSGPVARLSLELDGRRPEAGVQLGLFTPQSAQADRLRWQLLGLTLRFGEGRLWGAAMDDPEAPLPEGRVTWRPAAPPMGGRR
jgi:protein ImuB